MEISSIDVFCSISSKEAKDAMSWLIPSLEKQNNILKINLFLINYTGVGKIYEGKAEIGIVAIEEISSGKALGFGEAHNFAFNKVNPRDYFLIINPDVYLQENCVYEMIKKIESDEKIGIVEARQLPFEHPKEYDKTTGETPWASGFGILIRSELFKKIGGFDENFWMYCEDVDLSWRIWLSGYSVIYCKNAVAYHYTGSYFEYSDNRFYIEQFWGARNFLYIAYKFWGKYGEFKARRLFLKTDYPDNFKKEVLASFEKLKSEIGLDFYKKNKKNIKELKKYIKITAFNQYHEMK